MDINTFKLFDRNAEQAIRDQLDIPITSENSVVLERKEDGNILKWLYSVAWNDCDGYTHSYLISASTSVKSSTFFIIGIEYEKHTRVEDFVKTLPYMIKEAKRIRKTF